MMHTFLKTIAGVIAIPLVAVLNFAGYNIQPAVTPVPIQQTQSFGASNIIDTPIALFATSLASPITASATSMTLVSAATDPNVTLASSTYSFIIDGGQSDQEFVRADCTNTACTNMVRGLSMVDGATTIPSLAQPHRHGQSVKITDAPLLLVVTNIINGNNGFPNIVSYANNITTASFTGAQQIIDKAYADNLAFSGPGVINATVAARGIVQLATGLQLASSTGICSTTAPCVLSANNSTSTYNTATAALKVPVTQNNGKLDSNFISTSTLYSYIFPSGNPTMATSTITYNGSGLVWSQITHSLIASSTVINVNGNTASSTIYTATIPANVLATGNTIKIRIYVSIVVFNNASSVYLEAGYGNASSTLALTSAGSLNPGASDGYVDLIIQGNNSTSAQNSRFELFASSDNASTVPTFFIRKAQTKALTTDSTANQQITIVVRNSDSGSQFLTSGLSTTELSAL